MSECGLEIRPAQPGDVAAVRRLVRAAYAPYVPRIGREPAPMGADYETLVREGAVTLAVAGDVVVGVLVLRPQPDSLLLENVAVAPTAQRQGIGRTLIAFAEEHARELGVPKITLYTNARMVENVSLYRRLGYIDVEHRREQDFDRVFFEKPIA